MLKSEVQTSTGKFPVSFFEDDTILTVRQKIASVIDVHPDRLFILVNVKFGRNFYKNDPRNWEAYSDKVAKILSDFLLWLRNTKENNGRIYGYVAAAKTSTILNSINLDPNLLSAIADASLEKQTRFMPPNGIRIISPQELFDQKPTDVVIFPWNIKVEIANFIRENASNEIRLWCLIPEMHEVF